MKKRIGDGVLGVLLVFLILLLPGCGGGSGSSASSGGGGGTAQTGGGSGLPTMSSVSGVYGTSSSAGATASGVAQTPIDVVTLYLFTNGTAQLDDLTANIVCSVGGSWSLGGSTSNVTNITGTFANCAGPSGALANLPFTGSYTTPPNPGTGQVTLTGQYTNGSSSTEFVSTRVPLAPLPSSANPMNATYSSSPCPQVLNSSTLGISTIGLTPNYEIDLTCGGGGSIALAANATQKPPSYSNMIYDSGPINFPSGATYPTTAGPQQCISEFTVNTSLVFQEGFSVKASMNNVYSVSAPGSVELVNAAEQYVAQQNAICGITTVQNTSGTLSFNGIMTFFQDTSGVTHMTLTGTASGTATVGVEFPSISTNISTSQKLFSFPVNSSWVVN